MNYYARKSAFKVEFVERPEDKVHGVVSSTSFTDVRLDGTRLTFVMNMTITTKGIFGSTVSLTYRCICEPVENGVRLKCDTEVTSTSEVELGLVGQRHSFMLERLK